MCGIVVHSEWKIGLVNDNYIPSGFRFDSQINTDFKVTSERH